MDPEQKQLLARVGMQVKDSAKCLGVKFGEVTPQQAFAPAIQKAMLRALTMQHWDITLAERLALLELWIPPLLSPPARVVFLDKAVIASLQSVYHTAPRTTHYGITLPILSQDKDSGGFSLLTPTKFLLWQHTSTFVNFTHGDTALPATVTNPFLEWASHWGVPLGPSNLPTLQLGRLPYATMPLLALAAKSYSLLMSMSTLTVPPVPSHDPHLWHSRRFLDRWGINIYCLAPIRRGVHKASQLTTAHIRSLPHTYKSIYRLAWRKLRNSADAPTQRYHRPFFWTKWLSRRVATKLAPVKGTPPESGADYTPYLTTCPQTVHLRSPVAQTTHGPSATPVAPASAALPH